MLIGTKEGKRCRGIRWGGTYGARVLLWGAHGDLMLDSGPYMVSVSRGSGMRSEWLEPRGQGGACSGA